jgi:formylglycine-generating enzyme required for sulfatase activity
MLSMTKYFLTLLLFLHVTGYSQQRQAVHSEKEWTAFIRKYTGSMLYIPGGAFTLGNSGAVTAGKEDTTLLLCNPVRTVKVNDLYLCSHEVTNAEYREFVQWVRDSMALELLATAYDTSYYSNKAKKRLNWDKRPEIWKMYRSVAGMEMYDTAKARALSSLFLKDSSRAGKALWDTKKFAYSYHLKDKLLSTPWYPDRFAFVADSLISIQVYPDTLVSDREFPVYRYGEPMLDLYFWHPARDDYPVIGVNWQQANAYCRWRTQQIQNAILVFDGGHTDPDMTWPIFRLPTEAEWEHAASAIVDPESTGVGKKYLKRHPNTQPLYPWEGNSLKGAKGKWMANFGRILDQNGHLLKDYDESNDYDDGFYPGRIRLFPPNGFGLYDMAGNVAEWTSDKAVIDTTLTNTDTKDSTMLILNDMRLLKSGNNLRIVKGGSWATGPVYLQIGVREAYAEDKCSSKVGFRVAMTYQ